VSSQCNASLSAQGVKGVACIWRANEEFVDKYSLALELPTDFDVLMQQPTSFAVWLLPGAPCLPTSTSSCEFTHSVLCIAPHMMPSAVVLAKMLA